MPRNLELPMPGDVATPHSQKPSDPSAPTILSSHRLSKGDSKRQAAYEKEAEALEATHLEPENVYRPFIRVEDCSNENDPTSPSRGTKYGGKRRMSVSAEAEKTVPHGKKRTHIRLRPKSEQTRRLLLEALANAGSPLENYLEDLDKKTLDEVVKCFQGWHVRQGDEVIVQGQRIGEASCGLYVVESGEFNAHKHAEGEEYPGNVVKRYRRGDTFGELAVLYGDPRKASIVAQTDGHVWSIDRHSINFLKKQCMENRRKRYEELILKVPFLRKLGKDERAQVVDSLKPLAFKAGQTIIEQGADGEEFFLLDEGEAKAVKDGRTVEEYESGGFFGELALRNSEPWAATVVAVTDCTLAYLTRSCFDRLLGPLENARQLAKAASPRSKSSSTAAPTSPASGSRSWRGSQERLPQAPERVDDPTEFIEGPGSWKHGAAQKRLPQAPESADDPTEVLEMPGSWKHRAAPERLPQAPAGVDDLTEMLEAPGSWKEKEPTPRHGKARATQLVLPVPEHRQTPCRARTPPPIDYRMRKEDRLTYDLGEAEGDTAENQDSSPARPCGSSACSSPERRADCSGSESSPSKPVKKWMQIPAPAVAMKALMRISRGSPKSGASSPLATDAAAPRTV